MAKNKKSDDSHPLTFSSAHAEHFRAAFQEHGVDKKKIHRDVSGRRWR